MIKKYQHTSEQVRLKQLGRFENTPESLCQILYHLCYPHHLGKRIVPPQWAVQSPKDFLYELLGEIDADDGGFLHPLTEISPEAIIKYAKIALKEQKFGPVLTDSKFVGWVRSRQEQEQNNRLKNPGRKPNSVSQNSQESGLRTLSSPVQITGETPKRELIAV